MNCSEKSYIPVVFISISLKCMLSEHSSERLRFLIRKGGKNADLIGKEWRYEYTPCIMNKYYKIVNDLLVNCTND